MNFVHILMIIVGLLRRSSRSLFNCHMEGRMEIGFGWRAGMISNLCYGYCCLSVIIVRYCCVDFVVDFFGCIVDKLAGCTFFNILCSILYLLSI